MTPAPLSPSPASVTLVASMTLGGPDAPTVHVFSLAAEWARQGVATQVLAPRSPGLRGELPRSFAGARLIYGPSLRRLGLPNAAGALLLLPSLLRSAAAGRADIIYVRSTALTFVVGAVVRLATRSVLICEHNGWIADELQALGRPAWTSAVARRTQRLDARFAHAVRVVVPRLRTKLLAAGIQPDKVFVAGNGVDFERFRPMRRADALARAGLDPAGRYLGFLGNLVAWQGVQHSLHALAELSREFPELRLILAGDGPERGPLEALCRRLGLQERVCFRGEVPREGVNALLGCFDVALAPFTSIRNAEIGLSPLKLREYAAAGRTVVAAALPGIMEHEADGWLVTHRPDDAVDLAAAVRALLLDEERRRQMGEAARAYAEANFPWGRVASIISAEGRAAALRVPRRLPRRRVRVADTPNDPQGGVHDLRRVRPGWTSRVRGAPIRDRRGGGGG